MGRPLSFGVGWRGVAAGPPEFCIATAKSLTTNQFDEAIGVVKLVTLNTSDMVVGV